MRRLPKKMNSSRHAARYALTIIPTTTLLAAIVGLAGCEKKKPASADAPPITAKTSKSGLVLFTPGEAYYAGCEIFEDVNDAPSGQPGARLFSKTKARYAFSPQKEEVKVKPGERYRLSALFRIDGSTVVEAGSPGVILRATLFTSNEQNKDYPGGHIYIGAHGAAQKNAEKIYGPPPVKQWTKAEGIIEIPEGVSTLRLYIFCLYTSGNVYFADWHFDKVSNETPPTRLL